MKNFIMGAFLLSVLSLTLAGCGGTDYKKCNKTTDWALKEKLAAECMKKSPLDPEFVRKDCNRQATDAATTEVCE